MVTQGKNAGNPDGLPSILTQRKQKSASLNRSSDYFLSANCDGIEIDYHANPRPSHAFMQGKQYVLGKARICNGIYFESADEALERLNDYNCYHHKTPIICGVSEARYSKEELAKLKREEERTFNVDGHEMTGYEASQAMRRLETAVREQKGIKTMAQASCDPLAVREASERIKRYQEKYTEIADITGIARDKKRMTLTKGGTSGKIKVVKPDRVIEGHMGTPKMAEPNKVIDHKTTESKVDIRSFYGSNGYKKMDIHTTDHGNPKQHPFGKHGEHAEDYEWDNEGKLKNKTRRELTDVEREENGDIL